MKNAEVIELNINEMVTIYGGNTASYYVGYAIGAVVGTLVSFVSGLIGGLSGNHV